MADPILVYEFHNAPADLQALSPHGGDEDWLAIVPADMAKRREWISWLESGSPFGCCDVSEHDLPDGRRVHIGAHS